MPQLRNCQLCQLSGGFSCGFCHRGVNGFSCADAPPGYDFTSTANPASTNPAPAGEGAGAGDRPTTEHDLELGVDVNDGVVSAPGPGPVCTAQTNHCQRCSADAAVCEQCRDQHYLHGGVCGASCPEGTRTFGRGSFSRRCIDVPVGTATGCVPRSQDRSSHCNSCDDTDRCAQCRDSTYLHLGDCVAACPAGFVGTGNGRFNRGCAPAAAESTAVSVFASSLASSSFGPPFPPLLLKLSTRPDPAPNHRRYSADRCGTSQYANALTHSTRSRSRSRSTCGGG